MDKDICFNCAKQAMIKHHVVPNSVGGNGTVPLCIDCHSRVHGIRMSSTFLTKLGIFKKHKTEVAAGVLCYLAIYDTGTYPEIAKWLDISVSRVKTTMNIMLSLDVDELFDVIKENIAEICHGNVLYTHEYLLEQWVCFREDVLGVG